MVFELSLCVETLSLYTHSQHLERLKEQISQKMETMFTEIVAF